MGQRDGVTVDVGALSKTATSVNKTAAGSIEAVAGFATRGGGQAGFESVLAAEACAQGWSTAVVTAGTNLSRSADQLHSAATTYQVLDQTGSHGISGAVSAKS